MGTSAKVRAVAITPHMMPRPGPIIPLGWSGWLRRLLSDCLQWFDEREESQDRKG